MRVVCQKFYIVNEYCKFEHTTYPLFLYLFYCLGYAVPNDWKRHFGYPRRKALLILAIIIVFCQICYVNITAYSILKWSDCLSICSNIQLRNTRLTFIYHLHCNKHYQKISNVNHQYFEIDPKTSSTLSLKEIFVICFELRHQHCKQNVCVLQELSFLTQAGGMHCGYWILEFRVLFLHLKM